MESFIFMNIRNIIDDVLKEERKIGDFDIFEVVIGEYEGENIKHFHLISERKKSAIQINKIEYFLHGIYDYKLNSKELKKMVSWLISKPTKKIINNNKGEVPKTNYENIINTWNIINDDNLTPNINIYEYLNLH